MSGSSRSSARFLGIAWSRILRDLRRFGIVPEAYSQRFAGIVKFRNLLVHRYFLVNHALVADHLQQDLGDFAEFAAHVRAWLDRQAPLADH